MKYWGHNHSGDRNDISVCCSRRATRIPRGWMGQFRSSAEYKLIREPGERVSIKGTWIELCSYFKWIFTNLYVHTLCRANLLISYNIYLLVWLFYFERKWPEILVWAWQKEIMPSFLQEARPSSPPFYECMHVSTINGASWANPQQKPRLMRSAQYQCMRNSTLTYPKCRCQSRLSGYLIWHITWQIYLSSAWHETGNENDCTLFFFFFIQIVYWFTQWCMSHVCGGRRKKTTRAVWFRFLYMSTYEIREVRIWFTVHHTGRQLWPWSSEQSE